MSLSKKYYPNGQKKELNTIDNINIKHQSGLFYLNKN